MSGSSSLKRSRVHTGHEESGHLEQPDHLVADQRQVEIAGARPFGVEGRAVLPSPAGDRAAAQHDAGRSAESPPCTRGRTRRNGPDCRQTPDARRCPAFPVRSALIPPSPPRCAPATIQSIPALPHESSCPDQCSSRAKRSAEVATSSPKVRPSASGLLKDTTSTSNFQLPNVSKPRLLGIGSWRLGVDRHFSSLASG